ncbi:hypothetical protein ACFWY6_23255 [Streptomyces sp. NPDC059037]|uniref:hypothetical protein n=1 Tax=Streptomyces sp. NPDC059037 TaxID=3346710 RepID=UPI0036C213E8
MPPSSTSIVARSPVVPEPKGVRVRATSRPGTTRRELGSLTFKEYAEKWISRRRRITGYSTGDGMRSMLKNHIHPALGSRKMPCVDCMPRPVPATTAPDTPAG